jgi:hypothetical protein
MWGRLGIFLNGMQRIAGRRPSGAPLRNGAPSAPGLAADFGVLALLNGLAGVPPHRKDKP